MRVPIPVMPYRGGAGGFGCGFGGAAGGFDGGNNVADGFGASQRPAPAATGAWVDALQSSAAGKECQYLRITIESNRKGGHNSRVRGVKLMASCSEGQPAQKVELAARLQPPQVVFQRVRRSRVCGGTSSAQVYLV